MIRTLMFVIVIASLDLGLVSEEAHAFDEASGQSSTEYREPTYDSAYSLQTRFSAGNFSNRTMGVSGLSYSLGLGIVSVGNYEIYGDVPFLWGENRGIAIQELGNPAIGFDAKIFRLASVDFWIRTRAAVSQPSAKLASRFDTYRAGVETRFRWSQFFTSVGGGYRARVNENDRRVDVGNVTDFDAQLGMYWHRDWAFQMSLEWLRSDGAKVGELTYARAAEWGGVSPGVRYKLSGGFDLLTAITFPILQSRDENEMEVAFWDSTYPRISQATLRTQLGVRF
jgi:hypothetical protein